MEVLLGKMFLRTWQMVKFMHSKFDEDLYVSL